MVHRFDGRSPAFVSVLWQSSCFYHDFPCQVFGFNQRDVAVAIVGLDLRAKFSIGHCCPSPVCG